MIRKVAFIGHRVQDMARARRFYEELLGLEKTAEYEDKWCEFDTPEGKSIALDTLSPEGTPPHLALDTDDIEAEVARLKQAGVEIVTDVRDRAARACTGAGLDSTKDCTTACSPVSTARQNSGPAGAGRVGSGEAVAVSAGS